MAISKNKLFQNTCTGEKFCVLGNGPSLRSVDLTNLGGHKLVANDFCLYSDDFPTMDFKAYFLVDPLYKTMFTTLTLPIVEKILSRRIRRPVLLVTLGMVYNEIQRNKILVDRLQENNVTLLPFEYTKDDTLEQVDFDKPISRLCGIVLHTMILYAIYLGAKVIYLYGVDHDFADFSENDYKSGKDIHHFYSTNFKSTTFRERWEKRGLNWTDLENQKRVSNLQLEKIAEIATARNVRVLNATPQSKLKIFKFCNA